MKKTKLFKSLLVAAGLCVGASAWAEATSIYERGTTTAWSNADLSEWSCDYATPTINGGINVSTTNGGWACTKSIKTTSNSIVTLNATLKTGGASGRSGSYDYVQIGGVSVRFNEQDKVASVDVDGTSTNLSLTYNRTSSYAIQVIIDQATGAVSYTVGSATGNSTSTTAITNVVFGHSKAGRENYGINPILQKIEVLEEAQTVTTANYTLKYVVGEETIKTETLTGVVGQKISLTNDQKANFTKDNVTYIYESDDAAEQTITANGQAVATLTYHIAGTMTYNVTAKYGEDGSKVVASGTGTEGSVVNYYYPEYVLDGTTLYNTGHNNSNPYFGGSINLNENKEITINYSEVATDVIYFSDAEDIDGAIKSTSTNYNVHIRCSQGAGAYFTSNVVATTIPVGKYKIFGQVWGNSGTNLSINAGNRNVWSLATAGYLTSSTSDEFVVTKETEIILPVAGSEGRVLDLFYIQSLGEPTEDELAEAAIAEEKADKAARVFSIVGQNVTGGWDNDYAMTQSTNDGEEDIYTLTLNDFEAWPGTTYEYKLRDNNDWEGFVLPDGDNASFTVDKAGVYKLIFTADVEHYTLNVEKILTKSYTYTASFTNTYNWGAVYAYAWSGEGDTKVEQLGGWPGTQIYADANGLYTVTIMNKVEPEFIIFNANDGNKTGDLEFIDGAIYNYDGDKSVSINVTVAGYATYCSELALDFSNIEGLKAYRATINEGVVSFTEVEQVPAGEGILVKAAAGKYTVPSITSADAIDNVFVGVTEPKTISAGNFVLMNGDAGVGFYKTTKEFTVGANTAYIPALDPDAEGGARTFIGFDFDNTTTAIEGVATVKENNGEIYNLQGQRVMKAQKGLYIINGKKVLVK